MKDKPKRLCVDVFKREDLEQYHTKQLLQILKAQRIQVGLYCSDCCEHFCKCKELTDNNIKLLKEILATRPHIPNKKESKAIRKANIKKGV